MTTETKKQFLTDRYIATYPVLEGHEGMRLDQFMMEKLPTFSRQNIKKKIAADEITIANRKSPHRPSVKVHTGEFVTLVTYKSGIEDEYWRGEKLEFPEPDIIFEDDKMFVISKPAFMTTHPTGRHLFNVATVFLEGRAGHGVHSVHRLDRETSGILVVAKNPSSAQSLTDLFERSLVRKAYFFIAHKNEGHTEFPFTAHERLLRLEERMIMEAHPEDSDQGKVAETGFELLYEDDKYVLGMAFPRTGRQHQIRVHAATHGMPLVGDKIYHGGYEMFQKFKDLLATEEDHDLMQLPRHSLHAIAIGLPLKSKYYTFVDHIPSDLKAWILEKTDANIENVEEKIKNLVSQHLK